MNANDWINELQSNPDWTTTEIDWEAVDEIEKAVKALEIIKREFKPIIFEHDFGQYYLKLSRGNTNVFYQIKTKEEYDSLKEELK